jgi:hypothetical protein
MIPRRARRRRLGGIRELESEIAKAIRIQEQSKARAANA